MSGTKSDLDLQVATRLGMKKRDVSLVTAEFISVIRAALVSEGAAVVTGLGRLRVVEVRKATPFMATVGHFKQGSKGKPKKVKKILVTRCLNVHFSKSPILKDELEKHYGKAWR